MSLDTAVSGKSYYATDVLLDRDMKMGIDFEAAWQRLKPESHGGALYVKNGRGVRVVRTKFMIDDLGWPQLRSVEKVSVEPRAGCRRLPARQDHPTWIGLQYWSGSYNDPGRMEILWLDPGRDYMCIYRGIHQRKSNPWRENPDWQPNEPLTKTGPKGSFNEYDTIWEVMEAGQSPEGHWYPKTVRNSGAILVDGKRYIDDGSDYHLQVDFTTPVPSELFEPPADVREFKRK